VSAELNAEKTLATSEPDVSAVVLADLAAIEQSLTRVGASHPTRISAAARHNLDAGGKRLRALLTATVMRALGCDPRGEIDLIAAVELVHAGSLLHDDVIDGAELRRGRRAVHIAFDAHTAILAGDALLSWAFDRLARLGTRDLQIAMGDVIRDLGEGEALERERLFDATVDLVHVRRVNRLKTAMLFGYAAEAGALLVAASPAVCAAARAYGIALGEAFQPMDDLLDWEGDPKALGKQLGQDLAEGLVTLPVALAADRDPTVRDHIRAFWHAAKGSAHATERLAEVRRKIEDAGAFAATRELCARDADRAIASLDAFPPGVWRDQLVASAAAAPTRER
jgi:octaprenyl-diphosphate synthase